MTPPFIYALIDPIEPGRIRYIGMTMTAKKRPYHHRWAAQHDSAGTHCFRWIRKMLAEGREYMVMILEELSADSTLEDVSDAERDYIAAARAQGHPLTNDNEGGLGASQPSAETREKHRINSKKAWADPKLLEEQSARVMLRMHQINFTHAEEACDLMRKAWTPERRAAQAARNRIMNKRSLVEKVQRSEELLAKALKKLEQYKKLGIT